jgi:pimeloyl-ACP methyl ester carboxylesterase
VKILWLHGLESGPNGHKPTWLRAKGHELVAPVLPTQGTVDFLSQQLAPLPATVADEPYAVALKALESKPEVVAGSSFGGGLAARLAAEGAWAGPLVLMAPAAVKLFGVGRLPARRGRCAVVHGRGDEIVPCSDSVLLGAESACELMLWLVDDDHRLKKSVEAGVMDEAMGWAALRISR